MSVDLSGSIMRRIRRAVALAEAGVEVKQLVSWNASLSKMIRVQ